MKRPTGEVRQLPLLPRPAQVAAPTLRTAQNACYEALSLALKEGQVFAALTGPEGSGKTTVLEAVIADRRDRALRCIRIIDPDKVPASLADHIEQVAYAEAGKPENLERHIVLVVDDAHTASHELLLCLSRLAAMREPGRRVPQILLVGRSELWNRLTNEEYDALARRLAIRAALPAAEEDTDPWAVVENDVTQTMTQLRAKAEQLPAVPNAPDQVYERDIPFERDFGFTAAQNDAEAGPGRPEGLRESDLLRDDEVPPPSMFALFPDPPPKASPARGTRRRLVMPLVSLFVGVAAFAFALSFYDWPDMLGDMPWSAPKPSTPFIMPRSAQSPSFGLPQPPAAVQPAPVQAAAPPSKPELPVAAAPAPPALPPAPPPAPPVVAEVPAQPIEPPPPRAPPAIVALRTTPVEPPAPAPSPVALPPIASTVAPPVAQPRTPAVVEPPLAPAMVAMLLRRGDEQSAIGDISAARLLYERAAESGSGLAARQLARTYDPAFLPSAVEAALADTSKARQWYQRAATLGNAEAATRLKTLNQGR